MAIGYREGEAWLETEGAPMGVPFRISIASSSRPGRVYLIAREDRGDGDGMIIHQPACEAFRHRKRACSHVREACRMADDPVAWFFDHVLAVWTQGDNLTERGRAALASEIYRARQDAENRRVNLIMYRVRMEDRERVAAIRALMTDAEREEYDAARAAEAIASFA